MTRKQQQIRPLQNESKFQIIPRDTILYTAVRFSTKTVVFALQITCAQLKFHGTCISFTCSLSVLSLWHVPHCKRTICLFEYLEGMARSALYDTTLSRVIWDSRRGLGGILGLIFRLYGRSGYSVFFQYCTLFTMWSLSCGELAACESIAQEITYDH